MKAVGIKMAKSTGEKFTFFYRDASPFSQFFPKSFTSAPMQFEFFLEHGTNEPKKEITFLHCEQWMMFHKATLFGDKAIAEKIINTTEPFKCKKLGRQVSNFSEANWKFYNEAIIYEGNRLKFSQNPELLQALLDTEGTTLVEASPTDKIYGIGLSATDPRAQSRDTWRGGNLLGQVLTKLRQDLSKKT